MKIKVHQDEKEAIIAGVEPVAGGVMEVEIDLSTLTPDQRAVLALGIAIKGVRGTPQEVVAALDAEIAIRVAREQQQRQQTEEAIAALDAYVPQVEVGGHGMEHGIKYLLYRANKYLPSVPYTLYDHPSYIAAKGRQETVCAKAKAMTAAALAEVQPQIDAIKAMEAAAKAEEDRLKAEALAAKKARRLETGRVEIAFARDDRSEWGEPWIAKVTSRNGRKPEYDFSEGSYDAASEVLSIPCVPGDVIAYGQKNYKKAKRTVHEIKKMNQDGGLVSA